MMMVLFSRQATVFLSTVLLALNKRTCWIAAGTNPGENDELQAAILQDIFGAIPVSQECMARGKDAVTKIELSFVRPVPSKFDERHVKYEKDLFLLSMADPSTENHNQTWAFRLGRGGSIYSFIGAYGEAIPPQIHDESPFNDEVWQMTANALSRKEKLTYTDDIHQAGAYQRDGLPKPYYSPTLAVHCESNQCLVASHGTHAWIPTIHHHSVIFFSRYANCGQGVIEVSSMIYNTKYSGLNPDKETANKLDYLSAHWGGVRKSTLNDLILTEPGAESNVEGQDMWKVIRPLPGFGISVNKYFLKDSAGYTIFTQSITNPDMDTKFPMPEGVQENDTECLDEEEGQNNATASSDKNALDSETCVVDESSDSLNTVTAQTQRHLQRSEAVRLVASRDSCIQDSKRKTPEGVTIYNMWINSTAHLSSGYNSSPLLLYNPSRHKSIRVERVLSWSYNGQVFVFASIMKLDDLNARIGKDDELLVYYLNSGKRKEDNLGLSLVHGQDTSNRAKFKNNDVVRYGDAYFQRDYIVHALFSRDEVNPGEMWLKRQYLVTDSLNDLGPKSRKWRSLVVKDRLQELEIFRDLPTRKIFLFASSDRMKIGISLNQELSSCGNADELICTGTTTPSSENDGKMLYSVECGDDDIHIGPKLYAFSPTEQIEGSEDEIVRIYQCRNQEKGVSPNVRFLGFFENGSCKGISAAKYDPHFCETTVQDEL